jgi:Flp pilus assembly protein TadD
VLLALVAYATSLRYGFVYDDTDFIRDNLLLRDLGNYRPLGPGYAQVPNRYVAFLSFALNYAIGGLDASGYRAVNVAIHTSSAVLVYVLVRSLFESPVGRRSSLAPDARAVGFLAAALFVAHPLQTGAVTYVYQRVASLAAFLYLAAVVQYARWRLAQDRLTVARSAARYVAILVTSVLAMKTKEHAITLPASILLVEWVFFGRPAWPTVRALVPVFATAVLVPLPLLQWPAQGGGGLAANLAQSTRVQTEMSRLDYLRTQFVVLWDYLRLLVLPVGQNVDHDVAIRRTFADAGVVLGGLGLAALFGAAAFLIWIGRPERVAGQPPRDPAVRLVGFGIVWFFVTISVESSVLPIVDVIFEHRVYLPSVGAFIAFATGVAWLLRRTLGPSWRTTFLALAAALSVVLAVASLVRNRVWENTLTLWTDALSKSPGRVRPYVNLGAALVDRGDLAQGMPLLVRALQLDPDEPHANQALASALLASGGDLERATHLLEKALEKQPTYAEALANLGAVLNRRRRFDETIARLGSARERVELRPEAHFNLGVAFAATGRLREAEEEIRILGPVAPDLAAQLGGYVRQVQRAER